MRSGPHSPPRTHRPPLDLRPSTPPRPGRPPFPSFLPRVGERPLRDLYEEEAPLPVSVLRGILYRTFLTPSVALAVTSTGPSSDVVGSGVDQCTPTPPQTSTLPRGVSTGLDRTCSPGPETWGRSRSPTESDRVGSGRDGPLPGSGPGSHRRFSSGTVVDSDPVVRSPPISPGGLVVSSRDFPSLGRSLSPPEIDGSLSVP